MKLVICIQRFQKDGAPQPRFTLPLNLPLGPPGTSQGVQQFDSKEL